MTFTVKETRKIKMFWLYSYKSVSKKGKTDRGKRKKRRKDEREVKNKCDEKEYEGKRSW